MKYPTFGRVMLATAALALAGCETRSISNSGYDHSYAHGRSAEAYSGELSELDVLGVVPDIGVADTDIATALRDTARPQLSRNSSILLIQSGADFPDEPMIAALNQRFRVLPFSGRPAQNQAAGSSYSKMLRLAAARGGFDKIVCYWGVLESEQKNKFTKAVSWVPIAGYFVPDQRENMRIRLKAVIIDVATGRWTYVTPSPVGSSQLSSLVSRRDADQALVAALKQSGYEQLAQTLVNDHTT